MSAACVSPIFYYHAAEQQAKWLLFIHRRASTRNQVAVVTPVPLILINEKLSKVTADLKSKPNSLSLKIQVYFFSNFLTNFARLKHRDRRVVKNRPYL